MGYYRIVHYVVYHGEVIFVNPADWPDGKWRRRRLGLPKDIAFEMPKDDCEEIRYQAIPIRQAVRRVRHMAFDQICDEGIVIRVIRTAERMDLRKRLHDAEKEMKDAIGMLNDAMYARIEFKNRLKNGFYADGQNGTDAAIEADRNTAHALNVARERAVRAAKNLYPMLVGLGTITWNECERRIDEMRKEEHL